MGVKAYQSNFTNGEISDLMEGRIDFAKYFNSVHVMENMLVCPQGPAMLRPGFRFIAATKSNSTASRLMQFIFSDDDAFALEFGHQYVRFYKNRARITTTYTAWVSGTYYKSGQLVTYNSSGYYRCLISHTSGTFSTDLSAGKWVVTTGAGDTIYELHTNYDSEDIAKIKYCQSCDVLYLFHPLYPPQKLMRVDDDDWFLQEINFRPPPMVGAVHKLPATLTPGATTGNDVTFTATPDTTGASVFLTGDAGRMISYSAGRAVINSVTNTTHVVCDIIDDFPSTSPIVSGEWCMYGAVKCSLMPSCSPGIGSRVALYVGGETDDEEPPLISLVEKGSYNWFDGGSGVYVLKKDSDVYTSTEPSAVYLNGASNKVANSSLLTDGTWTWDRFASEYDGTYDTIYVLLDISNLDPDAISSVWRTSTNEFKKVFRQDDVGRYIEMFGGVGRIVSVSSLGDSVSCEILKEMEYDQVYWDEDSDDKLELQSTHYWNLMEKQWSEEKGYPCCGAFYEDRLILAGVPAYPENIRGSVIGDYENFSTGADDDDGLSFSLNGRTVSRIRWIEPREYLIAGALSDEWRLGPEDQTKALTPTNVIAKRQTNYGCADIEPVTIGNCTLFVQASLRKIREFALNQTSINNEYIARDLTMLAEHATEGKIAGMCYQQEPLSVVWVWMENGDLASFTYKKEEDVIGWQRHPVENGEVESMISIPGDGYDEVYGIIKRIINGSTVRYIEVLEKLFVDDDETYQANYGENAFFVDSGITYNDEATTTITGLGHLEGETVAILADGAMQPGKTVSGGSITLDKPASVVHAGLPYAGRLTTVSPEFALQDGTAQGRTKRVLGMIVRVKDSGTFKAGRDETNYDEYGFAIEDQSLNQTLFRTSDTPGGQLAALYTGDKVCPFEGDFSKSARLTIVQDKPLPLTVVAIIEDIEATQ